ncbi:uncharacterized protein LOC135393231 [Ornithodoros turicata]|uniref:uncharacterized protein LOC135393231 n=1 Tax=Ornithodoros turicata TaxID=34597 RepID=UPI003139EB7A
MPQLKHTFLRSRVIPVIVAAQSRAALSKVNTSVIEVAFPETGAPLGTDESFRGQEQEEPHLGTSILEELPIDMVKQVPLDYMHLVCLGVQKRLLFLWFRGTRGHRLSPALRETISVKHASLSAFVHSDFARKPRSMSELDRWKATELRMFLLYTGPLCLATSLPRAQYKHFLELHVAISILVSPSLSLSQEHTEYAHKLLCHFVRKHADIYGEESVSHNVHRLTHLVAEVRNHGPLDRWSSFPFENYMQTLKKYLRKPERPLEQLHNRKLEQRSITPEKLPPPSAVRVSLPMRCTPPLYRRVTVPRCFELRNNSSDSTCLLHDGSFVKITAPARYSIIKFPGEQDQVAVVPSSWIVGGSCLWPPEKEEKKVGLYVGKNKSPGAHWKSVDCEEMETYETYDEARQVLPLATNTSDLNCEAEYGRGKRRRTKRMLSDDEDDSSPPVTPPSQSKPRRQVQKKRRVIQDLSEEECSPPPSPTFWDKEPRSQGNDCSQQPSLFRPTTIWSSPSCTTRDDNSQQPSYFHPAVSQRSSSSTSRDDSSQQPSRFHPSLSQHSSSSTTRDDNSQQPSRLHQGLSQRSSSTTRDDSSQQPSRFHPSLSQHSSSSTTRDDNSQQPSRLHQGLSQRSSSTTRDDNSQQPSRLHQALSQRSSSTTRYDNSQQPSRLHQGLSQRSSSTTRDDNSQQPSRLHQALSQRSSSTTRDDNSQQPSRLHQGLSQRSSSSTRQRMCQSAGAHEQTPSSSLRHTSG